MSFCTVAGLEGRVFIPSPVPTAGRRHACPDCFACQACSRDRCRVCRGHSEPPAAGPARPSEENTC